MEVMVWINWPISALQAPSFPGATAGLEAARFAAGRMEQAQQEAEALMESSGAPGAQDRRKAGKFFSFVLGGA
jgi:hypothetical protein